MRSEYAGLVGGIAAGLAISAAMEAGRRNGWLQKTLAEDAEDWLDRTLETRTHIGQGGTTALEQTNHLLASAGFGLAYSVLRNRFLHTSGVGLGAAYGAALYAINIAGLAPVLGMTEGEHNAPNAVRMERLGVHLLYGALTGLVADLVSDPNVGGRGLSSTNSALASPSAQT